MFQLNNLTASANQTSTAVLADGSSVVLTFHYWAVTHRWTFDASRKGFAVKGKGLSSHKNILRPWRNAVPFGLRVQTQDGTDPFMPDDLSSGRVAVIVLDGTAGSTDLTDAEKAFFQ